MKSLPERFRAVIAAAVVFLAFFAAGAVAFERFFSTRVIVNLFGDNAFLGIAAIGATFVILAGGIDLSTGAVMAAASTFAAALIERRGWHPGAAIPFVVGLGAFYGFLMGTLIRRFKLAPFLVTLAGMFFARAAGFLVEPESLAIRSPAFAAIGEWSLEIDRGVRIGPLVFLWVGLTLAAIVVAARTRFGRAVYAVGGDEQSALYLGIPVGPTKTAVYVIAGAMSALGGVAYALYMKSGNPAACVGLELDVIAAVVIGGAALSGGAGYPAGTFIGVLVLGLVQTLITFHGGLNSWWTRIVIGLLVLLFIGAQRVTTALADRAERRRAG